MAVFFGWGFMSRCGCTEGPFKMEGLRPESINLRLRGTNDIKSLNKKTNVYDLVVWVLVCWNLGGCPVW
jgi:hypothetical protein